MTDKLVSAEQERLLEIVEDLLDSQSSLESDLEWILMAMKNNCKLLPEKQQKIPFISCVIKGGISDPEEVLEVSREILYADLISTIKE
jgi:hypothetical protein